MSFLINDAMAAANTASAEPASGLFSFVMIAMIFVLFYFMLIRPQNKRAKEHRDMINSLKKGDEIVTSGGLLAKVTALEEQYVTIKLAEGIEIKMQRNAVSAILPKGTLKSI